MPKLSEFIFGSQDKLKKFDQYTPGQNNLLNQLLQALGIGGNTSNAYNQAQGNLSDILGGGDEAYNRFSAPYMRQFQEETLPGIAERFAGMGALSSSGFGQALGSAGAGLQERLASLREGLRQNAGQQAFGQYNQGVSSGLGAQPFGYTKTQGGQGLLNSIMQGGGAAGAFSPGAIKGYGQDIGAGFNKFASLFGGA